MVEIVRVDARSQAEVEAFLARELKTPIRLGRVWLAPGRIGATVAAIARASAITLGPIICLDAPNGRVVLESSASHIDSLGGLLVHELVHAWQFQRRGTLCFLWSYMISYFTKIYILRSFDHRARRTAYHAIPAEIEAFALESRWVQSKSCRRV